MKLKKVLNIGTTALLVAVICFFRFGSRSGTTDYGAWFPTRDIHLDKVIVQTKDDPRFTAHLGLGKDILVASITAEEIKTAPTLYLPIFQFGEAKGTAQISLILNGRPEGTMDVSIDLHYEMFGLLPNLFIRSQIQREINRAIVKT
ncbi:MAG: hypothetical protein ABW223_12790, partial [Rariglobus sp.]